MKTDVDVIRTTPSANAVTPAMSARAGKNRLAMIFSVAATVAMIVGSIGYLAGKSAFCIRLSHRRSRIHRVSPQSNR